MIVENEKTESDRIRQTIQMRNEDLKRKYDQLMIDNNHRINIQEHIQEISEMKRLTGLNSNLYFFILYFSFSIDELSNKHVNEIQTLLRRVQV